MTRELVRDTSSRPPRFDSRSHTGANPTDSRLALRLKRPENSIIVYSSVHQESEPTASKSVPFVEENLHPEIRAGLKGYLNARDLGQHNKPEHINFKAKFGYVLDAYDSEQVFVRGLQETH